MTKNAINHLAALATKYDSFMKEKSTDFLFKVNPKKPKSIDVVPKKQVHWWNRLFTSQYKVSSANEAIKNLFNSVSKHIDSYTQDDLEKFKSFEKFYDEFSKNYSKNTSELNIVSKVINKILAFITWSPSREVVTEKITETARSAHALEEKINSHLQTLKSPPPKQQEPSLPLSAPPQPPLENPAQPNIQKEVEDKQKGPISEDSSIKNFLDHGQDILKAYFKSDPEKRKELFITTPLFKTACTVDPRFNQLGKILPPLIKNPDLPFELIDTLLAKTFFDEHATLSPEQATRIAGDILYLTDHSPEKLKNISPFDADLISKEFSSVLEEQRLLFNNELNKKIKFFDQAETKIAQYSIFIAKQLLGKDGSLNTEALWHIKEILFKENPANIHKSHLLEIFSVFEQFESDPELLKKLQSIPIPQKNSPYDIAIRATLNIPPENELNQHDVLLTSFSSLLVLWGQVHLNNCYAISFCNFVKDTSLHLILDNLKEIAEKGFLTKVIQEKECSFPALPIFAPAGEIRHISSNQKKLAILSTMPEIKTACSLLGYRPNEIENALKQTISKATVDDTWDITKALKLMGADHKINRDTVEKALSFVHAVAQPPLLRLIENGAVSMLFPPFSIPVENSLLQRKLYTSALLNTFLDCALDIEKENKRKKTPLPVEDLIRTLHTINDHPLSPSNKVQYAPFLQKQKEEAILSVILSDISRQTALAKSHFDVLSHIRIAIVPPGINESFLKLIICTQIETGEFVPVNETQFDSILKKAFILMATNLSAVSPGENSGLQEYFEELLDRKDLSTQFKEHCSYTDEKVPFISTDRFMQTTVQSTSYAFETVEASRIGIDNVYFNEKFTNEEISLSEGKASLLGLLGKYRQYRTIYGSHESLSFEAIKSGHAFRIIPNNPSLISATEKSIDSMEEETIKKFKSPLSIDTEKRLSNTLKSLFPEDLHDVFGAGRTAASLEEAINLWKIKLEEKIKKPLEPSQINTIIFDLLEPFPHIPFANTNWVDQFEGIVQEFFYSYGFNPFTKNWQVVITSKSGNLVEANPKLLPEAMAIFLPPSDFIRKHSHNKNGLLLTREIQHSLHSLESTFIAASNELMNRNILKKEEKTDLYPLPQTKEGLLQKSLELSNIVNKDLSDEELITHHHYIILTYAALKKAAITNKLLTIELPETRLGPDKDILSSLINATTG